MTVANKIAFGLRAHVECEKHKKPLRGETNSAKVTSSVIHWEATQIMLF